MWNLSFYVEGGTQIECVWKLGAEEKSFTYEGGYDWILEKKYIKRSFVICALHELLIGMFKPRNITRNI
jgi:hypothetical protein